MQIYWLRDTVDGGLPPGQYGCVNESPWYSVTRLLAAQICKHLFRKGSRCGLIQRLRCAGIGQRENLGGSRGVDTQGIPDSHHDAALTWSLTYSSNLLPTSKSSDISKGVLAGWWSYEGDYSFGCVNMTEN